MTKISYHAPEMHCGACEASVRKALDRLEGILGVEVDLASKEVRVQFDESRTSGETVRASIESAGFDVT